MMNLSMTRAIRGLLLVAFLSSSASGAYLPSTGSSDALVATNRRGLSYGTFLLPKTKTLSFNRYIDAARIISSKKTTQLFASSDDNRNSFVYGTDRGNILMGFALILCVWIFSIPPEFRRAHICTSDRCVINRAACYDCVTLDEWSSDLVDYYRNGGGIQFDFTVDQSTKDFWADSLPKI